MKCFPVIYRVRENRGPLTKQRVSDFTSYRSFMITLLACTGRVRGRSRVLTLNAERHCRWLSLLVAAYSRTTILSGVPSDHFLDVEPRSVDRVAILVVVCLNHGAVLLPLDVDVFAAEVVGDAARQTSVGADSQVVAIYYERRTQATCSIYVIYTSPLT